MNQSKILLFGLLTCLLSSCSPNNNTHYRDKNINIKLNEIRQFDFHTSLQKEYIDDYYYRYDEYAHGIEELNKPQDLEISFNVKSKYSNLNYEFIIDTNDGFTNSKTYKIDTPKITLNNLLLDTTYYYKLKAYNDDTYITELNSSFDVTTKKLRNLSIPHVKNARDIGGYETVNNKKVKQGLFYRCGRLNTSGVEEYNVEIDSSDKEIFNDLQIKSEVDLRYDDLERGYQENSPLDNVSYYKYPMTYSGNILLMNKELLPSLFEFFANEDNYPLIIHCNIGTDRTGMVCFLIESILGMKIEDIYRDYLFSNYSNIGSVRNMTAIDSYLQYIGAYSDDKLQENTIAYLIKNGVSKENIDKIKDILLDS